MNLNKNMILDKLSRCGVTLDDISLVDFNIFDEYETKKNRSLVKKE